MKPGEISLVVCDDAFISELNQDYRKREGPTDVLSFAMREGELGDTADPVLGDIIISIQTTERQARENGKTVGEEFRLLFTHGVLHLLGYTHGNDEDAKKMQALTNMILGGKKGNS
jgi:probable rRNA maturation factor